MLTKPFLLLLITFGLLLPCSGQETAKETEREEAPAELSVIKSAIGVWDVEFEVWANGLDAPPIKFKGLETNRAFGEHWMASDLDSSFGGQTMTVHSVIGYDLDKKKLVGTVIDHGPYSATMLGEFDAKTNTVSWVTKAKNVDGSEMIQHTTIEQKSPNERILILKVPGKEKGKFNKFMRGVFTKRQ